MTAEEARTTDERARVQAVVERYFMGHATQDAAHMRAVFPPTAHIEGMRDGQFVSWTLEEYCKLLGGQPATDEQQRRRSIDAVTATDSAAAATATLVHGDTTFTDHFVLLKVDRSWRIANKVDRSWRIVNKVYDMRPTTT